MVKKQLVIISIAYFLATLIRGLIGVSYNPFFDDFDLMLLLKDFMIWVLSYTIVTIIVSQFTRAKHR
jgi:hypothetical protein